MIDKGNTSDQGSGGVLPAAPRPRLQLSFHRPALLWMLLALLGALVFTTIILLIAGASPLDAYRMILFGAFATPVRMSDAVMLGAPLLLCAAGLTLTFAAGLYNLGIEGQVALGAVFALGAIRLLPDTSPPMVIWIAAFISGALGGMSWSLIVAGLKLYGRVSEIFAGLGLNFLATGLALYLVFGPWKRPGQASMAGTELLPQEIWLPTLNRLRLAPAAPVVALVALVIVWFVLSRTRWGLSLRATGLNPSAAERLGVPANRRIVEALLGCGALAGFAGAIQLLAVFHALIPNVSSGIGLLGLLVVLLVRANPAWVLPVVVAFACFSVGSLQLPLVANIDSSISGVLQGSLVLFALLGRGLSSRR